MGDVRRLRVRVRMRDAGRLEWLRLMGTHTLTTTYWPLSAVGRGRWA